MISVEIPGCEVHTELWSESKWSTTNRELKRSMNTCHITRTTFHTGSRHWMDLFSLQTFLSSNAPSTRDRNSDFLNSIAVILLLCTDASNASEFHSVSIQLQHRHRHHDVHLLKHFASVRGASSNQGFFASRTVSEVLLALPPIFKLHQYHCEVHTSLHAL